MTEISGMAPDTGRAQHRRIALTVAVGSMLVIAWMMQSFAAGPVWLAGVLGALAAVIGGFPIASKAIRAARHRQLSVDALVAIAAVAAMAIGHYTEAGVVIFILLLGELLEEITIAMVGDGINDAPALATAAVGIAMGKVGSDIAMQAADVVLLTDDLLQVPAALALGRKALTVIRQNLIFALVFNTTMIYLASEGILSMAIGALCHQGSSLFVILNSMRLLLVTKRGRTPRGAI